MFLCIGGALLGFPISTELMFYFEIQLNHVDFACS